MLDGRQPARATERPPAAIARRTPRRAAPATPLRAAREIATRALRRRSLSLWPRLARPKGQTRGSESGPCPFRRAWRGRSDKRPFRMQRRVLANALRWRVWRVGWRVRCPRGGRVRWPRGWRVDHGCGELDSSAMIARTSSATVAAAWRSTAGITAGKISCNVTQWQPEAPKQTGSQPSTDARPTGPLP